MSEDINVTDGTVLEALNGKVDIDFNNVPSNSVSFARCSKEVTNCITEVPQSIQLELNNGTLTLRAGSKVIVPNGAGIFDEVVINSDLTYGGSSNSWSNTKWLVYSPNGTLFVNNGDYTSGSTYTGGTYGIWYDTTNNSVKYTNNGGSTWVSGYSLPLAQITITSGIGVISINQIFNGFGYIGSTIWVDKGVKYLVPNGRNENGTLKNEEVTTSRIATSSFDSSHTGTHSYVLGTNENIYVGAGWYYDAEANLNRTADGAKAPVLVQNPQVVVNAGNIESFQSKQPFRVLDYNTQSIVETYKNGTSWYRVWSDGFKEQGGYQAAGTAFADVTVTFLKPFSDANYTFIRNAKRNLAKSDGAIGGWIGYTSKTATTVTFIIEHPSYALGSDWYACGY